MYTWKPARAGTRSLLWMHFLLSAPSLPHPSPFASSLQWMGMRDQARDGIGLPLKVSSRLRPSVTVPPPPDRDVHRLVFPAVGPQHAGVYKSVIANKLGKAACYAHLYVTGEAGTLVVSCMHSLASGTTWGLRERGLHISSLPLHPLGTPPILPLPLPLRLRPQALDSCPEAW